MKLAAATIAILGIIGMTHRSEQTAKQIEITNLQNKYSNYFSHLKEFKEQIYDLELVCLQPKNINKLYKIMFPQNTHTNFDPIGTVDTLTALLDEMNVNVNLKIDEVSKSYCKETDKTPYSLSFVFFLTYSSLTHKDYRFCLLQAS